MKKINLWFILAILSLPILAGVSMYLVGVNQSGPVQDAVAQATAAVIYKQMTPSPKPPEGTPTMSIMDFSYTQVAYQQSLSLTSAANQQALILTQDANQANLDRQKLQAEQMALQATVDANHLNATATADANTAQAVVALSTAHAAETMTAIAQQTNAAETQMSNALTATMAIPAATWTAEAVNRNAQIQDAEVQKVQLATQQAAATNLLRGFGPWALMIALAYVGGRGLVTYIKTRTHARDEHGRTQTLQRELPDGGVVFIKPDQMETGIVKVTAGGEVIRYAPIDSKEQSDINRGNAIAEIVSQLPTPYAQAGKNLLGKFAGGQMGAPSVQIMNEARALSPVLDEAESKLVEE